ncbi:hypothetical protein R1sor_018176 [Riccia sorocarpa]|uniref:NmrA-like domain-containing protein n=1 Tax=Riccia sorocarpa TaxID=122646 RepID=A0ABD3IC82_9MARC
MECRSKSKVLIIGATGYFVCLAETRRCTPHFGAYLAKASIKLGYLTFLLHRSVTPSDPAKAELVRSFQESGATLLQCEDALLGAPFFTSRLGDIDDHESLVAALRQVDVVISAVSRAAVPSQVKILEPAKEAGTIKRFIPSEFGNDVDRLADFKALEGPYGSKRTVRRAVEKSGLPYTIVLAGGFAGHPAAKLGKDDSPPSREKVTIWGDGNVKAVNKSMLKSIDDPRAENKYLHIRPKENIVSQNDLVALWEKKIGKTLEKSTVSKEELLKKVEETPVPGKIMHGMRYVIFILGVHANFELGTNDVEATVLYPDVPYTTVSAYLDQFV